jgi:23S rRNA pseudouridine1911/1915/1917 synthase
VSNQAGDQTLVVSSAATGERLDRWLAQQFPDLSRNTLQGWIREGRILVNDATVRPNYRLAHADAILVPAPPPPLATHLVPQAIALDILYEDADILVVNKPAGMVVHPAAGHPSGTLVNAVLHHCPDLGGVGGEKRPGIVHRLDRDTSGVMVVAKHDRALAALQKQFKQRAVVKQYVALVEGRLKNDQGEIDAPIGRHPTDRKRQAVLPQDDSHAHHSRDAVTEYTVIARYSVAVRDAQGHGNFTLLHAHPITGRTHQIRVHLAWHGHPIVGDPIYGLRTQRLHAPRLCLHAQSLRLRLPSSGEEVEFAAPMPPDLAEFLQTLVAG